MGIEDVRLSQVGDFLKARRSELRPRDVGLPATGGPRRVRGLRREEVAQLAAISADYYTRVERGRLAASAPVLDELARVLQLNDDQRRFLFELAGKPSGQLPGEPVRTISPQTRRLLERLGDTPALVLGRCMDILAWNRMAAALLTDFSTLPDRWRNYAWMVFSDPSIRTLHTDWDIIGQLCVAFLHMEAARDPQDPRLLELVAELSGQDPDFRDWWAGQHVATRSSGTKRFHHAVVGDLVLDWDTLTCATSPEQQVIVWTAESGSASEQSLAFLASWAADHLPDEDGSAGNAQSPGRNLSPSQAPDPLPG